MRRLAALSLLAAVAAGRPVDCLAATSKEKPRGSLNVLLVTLDTTRPDRLGAYGYEKAETPAFDALAREGVRFENAYCATPVTLPSHCSILTGTYPLRHKVRNNGGYYLTGEAVTLAERLKGEGYETAAFVGSFSVDSRSGLGQGFDVYDDRFGRDELLKTLKSERPADKVADAFLSWLGAKPRDRFFAWVHFYDPHSPYDPPSPYKERFASDLYEGEIAFMDRELGRIIDGLRAKGLLDRTVVVAAGDHGESLGEKGEPEHGIFIYDATVRVPLVLSAPGLPRGLVVRSRASLVDVMPTVLDALGLKVNREVQGTSLLPLASGKGLKGRTLYLESFYPVETFGWSELVGIVEGDRKYIRAPRPELFDLATDPGETKDLSSREARTAVALDKRLDEVVKANLTETTPGRRTLTGEEGERLRSLGYVGAGATPKAGRGPLPDPKDRIGELSVLAEARSMAAAGRIAEAEERFRELIRLQPDVPWNYTSLSGLLAKTGRGTDSLEVLREGLRRIPDSVVLLLNLADAFMRSGRFGDAAETSRAVLKLDPRNFDALVIAGWSEDQSSHWKEAADLYEAALELEPENKTVRISYAYVLGALGRGEEAASMDEALKKEYPDDPEIYGDLSVIYMSMGKPALAEDNLRRAVALDPSPGNHHRLAVLLGRLGKLEEAIAEMKAYLQTTPEGETSRKAQAKKAITEWERRLGR